MSLIPGGKIVNTHGVRGGVKITPWTNTPEFLAAFRSVTIDGAPMRVLRSFVNKNSVVMELDGVATADGAQTLRGKTVYIEKDSAPLDAGEVFVSDVLGLDAIDDDTGVRFGTIADFFSLPSNGVYVVRAVQNGEDRQREYMIPAVSDFVREINVAGGYVRFRLIEGL
ncbi:MAG: ribosome maturation factor RimM [Oscillospiraceae bacterium]|jgi:16S rRNA processing protein RimM|nr:ribosome maturation factor RimM [Oscillospiraceae bacterium]